MRGTTFLLGPSSFDRRNVGKISLFCLSLLFLSLSLSIYPISSPSLLFSSPLFFFFSFLFSLSYPPNILSFCFLSSHFRIFSFSHFLISHFSLISLIFSSISISSFSLFYFSFGLHQPNGPKVGETSPHFPPLPLVITTIFSLNFLIFLFPLFPSFDTWLNVSHSHNCTTWIMPCVTPLGCHVAST